mmetsp:Transcript_23147/g.22624  ORF Transcript_23147/g.22624 Transcript_23147/m.22624 type:complete len:130 (+) Transcript_23147:1101-1490(+)
MNLVFKEALAVRTNTPYSFRDLPELQVVFSFEQQAKDLVIKQIETIENMPCLPILSEEIFFYSYPEVISCSNPQCLNSLNQFRMVSEGGQNAIQTSTSGNSQINFAGKRRHSVTIEEDFASPSKGNQMK